MTTVVVCVCVRVCARWWRGWGGMGVSVHSDEAHSQCLLFTDGPFARPGLRPTPPSKFSTIPYRIPLSGASGMAGREGRLSTTNVFFRNRLLLVWLPMKTTQALAAWTNCPVLSSGAEGQCKAEKAELGSGLVRLGILVHCPTSIYVQ